MVGVAGPAPSREEVIKALSQRHGEELQKKFSCARAAVCGLGGLGSNIALALARAGLGTLHLIDFDRVELSNLNRQQYSFSQLGLYKTEALRENILSAAPYCRVIINTVRINESNFSNLLSMDGIICEALDRAEEKAMLVNNILEAFPDKYIIAASGMAGLGSSNSIRTRRISDRFYLCGDQSSDSEKGLGLFSARAMLCAAHQANMVLRILAGEYEI